MHRPSELDTRLAAWLEEGPTTGPDEVLSRTFARARSTRQVRDRFHLPTSRLRFQPMNAVFKIAAVALIALVVGVAIDPLRPSLQYSAAGPSPSPSPAPVQLPTVGVIDGGTYYVDAGRDIAPARFTLEVPSRWVADTGGVVNGAPQFPSKGWEAEVGVQTWILTHVYSDSCHHTTLVDAGTTVDEMTTALLAQGSVVASGPTNVTVAGYPAKHIELVVPADLDFMTCANGGIRFWPGPGPDMSSGMCCSIGPGMTERMDIVDVDGHRWVIAAKVGPGASPEDVAKLQAVLDSIQIDAPAAPSAAPATSTSPSPSP